MFPCGPDETGDSGYIQTPTLLAFPQDGTNRRNFDQCHRIETLRYGLFVIAIRKMLVHLRLRNEKVAGQICAESISVLVPWLLQKVIRHGVGNIGAHSYRTGREQPVSRAYEGSNR